MHGAYIGGDRGPSRQGETMTQQLVLDVNVEDQKHLARILYLVHGASFILSLGMLSFLPLIVNYVKRPDTAGTLVHSHHTWMIRSFWIYIACCVVAWLLAITLLGIPVALLIFAVAWLWKAYRLIRGFLDLNTNRAMPVI
jgi:uncharacterized membrane protein